MLFKRKICQFSYVHANAHEHNIKGYFKNLKECRGLRIWQAMKIL